MVFLSYIVTFPVTKSYRDLIEGPYRGRAVCWHLVQRLWTRSTSSLLFGGLRVGLGTDSRSCVLWAQGLSYGWFVVVCFVLLDGNWFWSDRASPYRTSVRFFLVDCYFDTIELPSFKCKKQKRMHLDWLHGWLPIWFGSAAETRLVDMRVDFDFFPRENNVSNSIKLMYQARLSLVVPISVVVLMSTPDDG
jgi:hypothetical protein